MLKHLETFHIWKLQRGNIACYIYDLHTIFAQTDGSAGFLFLHAGVSFTLSGHCSMFLQKWLA